MTNTKTLTEIDITEYRILLSRPLHPSEAAELRGFFGRVFSEEIALHHHQPDGSLRYDYPRVQSKVLKQTAHIIGLAEGAPVVTRLWAEVGQARLGNEE